MAFWSKFTPAEFNSYLWRGWNRDVLEWKAFPKPIYAPNNTLKSPGGDTHTNWPFFFVYFHSTLKSKPPNFIDYLLKKIILRDKALLFNQEQMNNILVHGIGSRAGNRNVSCHVFFAKKRSFVANVSTLGLQLLHLLWISTLPILREIYGGNSCLRVCTRSRDGFQDGKLTHPYLKL